MVQPAIALAFTSQALAQNPAPAPEQKQQPTAKPETAPVPAPKPARRKEGGQAGDKTLPQVEKSENEGGAAKRARYPHRPSEKAYAAMPVAGQLAIQSDLICSGDLEGAADPDFSERAITSVRAFQLPQQGGGGGGGMRGSRRHHAGPAAGPHDRHPQQEGPCRRRLVEDEAMPGVRPRHSVKLVPRSELGATGTRWSLARGEIQIETFREKMAGATLSQLFEDLKKKPASRRVEDSPPCKATHS